MERPARRPEPAVTSPPPPGWDDDDEGPLLDPLGNATGLTVGYVSAADPDDE